MVLEHYGVPTAPFAIVHADTIEDKALGVTYDHIQSMIQNSRHAKSLSSYPLFAKPLAEGSSKGIMETSKIRSPQDLCHVVNTMLSCCPTSHAILIETFLSGREFTVGVLGSGKDACVLGATELRWKASSSSSQTGNGSGMPIHFTTENSKAPDGWDGLADEVKADRMDPEVELACQVALKAWTVLGCRDGGRVDIRIDSSSGQPVANVMEVSAFL